MNNNNNNDNNNDNEQQQKKHRDKTVLKTVIKWSMILSLCNILMMFESDLGFWKWGNWKKKSSVCKGFESESEIKMEDE